MKGLQKVAICAILAVCMLLSFVGCAPDDFSSEYGEELIKNGSFENGLDSWEIVGADEVNTVVELRSHAPGSEEAELFGAKYVSINNKVRAQTYLKQTIRLEKGAVYRLESDIYIYNTVTGDSSTNYKGAYVAFAENVRFAPIGTEKAESTKWGSSTSHAYYFTSEFDTVTVMLTLGSQEGNAKGVAFFDDISITKVDASTLENKNIYSLDAYIPDNGGLPGILFIVLGIVLVFGLCYGVWVAIRRKGYQNREIKGNGFVGFIKKYYPLVVIAFIALAVRVVLALFYKGNSADVEAYAGGAVRLATDGLPAYWASSTQKILPIQLYLMWISGTLINLFSAKGATLYLLVKLPAIICDICAMVFIYKLGKKFIGEKGGLLSAILYGFIPTLLTATSVWGEIDSIVAFVAILLFYLILNPNDAGQTKRFIGIFITLLVGAMLKIEFMWLIPLALAFIVYTFIKKKETRLVIGVSAGVSLVLFYLVSIPFCTTFMSAGRPFYVFERYFEMLFGGTHYYSQDAFNLYAMVGLNWRSASRISVIMNVVFAVILFAFIIFIYLKNRSRVEMLLLASFSMIGAYTFAIDMSPTVLVVALALMLAYAIVANEKRVYLLFAVYALIGFLNSAILLNNGGALSSFIESTARYSSKDAFFIIMSVVNTLSLFGFIYLLYDICINDKLSQIVFIEGDDVVTYWGRITYKLKRK